MAAGVGVTVLGVHLFRRPCVECPRPLGWIDTSPPSLRCLLVHWLECTGSSKLSTPLSALDPSSVIPQRSQPLILRVSLNVASCIIHAVRYSGDRWNVHGLGYVFDARGQSLVDSFTTNIFGAYCQDTFPSLSLSPRSAISLCVALFCPTEARRVLACAGLARQTDECQAPRGGLSRLGCSGWSWTVPTRLMFPFEYRHSLPHDLLCSSPFFLVVQSSFFPPRLARSCTGTGTRCHSEIQLCLGCTHTHASDHSIFRAT